MKLIILIFALLISVNAKAEPVSYEAIHYALTQLPVAVQDRDNEFKQEQLSIVAHAIEKATQQVKWPNSDRTSLAAYLVAVGYHESRYRIQTHEGVAKAHSYGLWQVTPWAHKVTREELIGISQSQTDRSALIAATALSRSWQCGPNPADMFTAYYGGAACKSDWRTLKSRVRTFWWVRQTIVSKNG